MIEIDLAPAVAVVTGGARGIGETTCKTLARAGAAVAVVDLSGGGAARVADEISADGGKALAIEMDIAAPDSVRAGVQDIRAKLGSVGILVNNAAATDPSVVKSFAETTPDVAQRIVDVTFMGTMNITRELMADIVEAQGRIINIISDSARTGDRGVAVYAAAKAALMGLTKSIAKEIGRSGATVNGVSPGTTVTPSSSAWFDSTGGPERLLKSYPLGRLGEPSDIANAVLFFASPLSSWITGQILSVSGGYTMV